MPIQDEGVLDMTEMAEVFSPEVQSKKNGALFFEEDYCSFYGWFDVFWEDIDNDENMEIVFSAQGTGCGAVGDTYKAVFKYKDYAMERMALPFDFEADYDCGLRVDLIQEAKPNSYSAYCPYFDEQIFFHRENLDGYPPSDTAQITGGNARGFYNLCVAEYEGKRALPRGQIMAKAATN